MASNLQKAKKNKSDEFYTQLSDISNELKHYTEHFHDKVVYCNCDNPEMSKFWNYFVENFHTLGLKKLIATYYNHPSYLYVAESDFQGKIVVTKSLLKENGDFRSPECQAILKESDIVVTNPPFSLFRAYIALLIEHGKSFIVIGHQNAITYKEIFKYMQSNQMWLGYGFPRSAAHFINKNYQDYATDREHKDGMIRVAGVNWFTNVEIPKRHQDIILNKTYNRSDYLKYDNYPAINVDKTKDIPCDYYGLIGVPITFMTKYNPEQFQIIGIDRVLTADMTGKSSRFTINGKELYARIVIKRID